MLRDILVTSDEEAQRLLAAFKAIPNMQGRLKIVELAELEGVSPKTIRRSLDRLISVGLVEPVKRGRWRIANPCHENRHGTVDLTGTYRNSIDQLPSGTNPFTPRPHTSPGNGSPVTHSEDTGDPLAKHTGTRETHSAPTEVDR